MLAARLEGRDLLGIAEIGDVDLVDLQIFAAGRREGTDGFVVGFTEVAEEPVQRGVGGGVDRLPAAAEVYHRGRRDGLLRHRVPHMRRQIAEVVQHHRLAPADLAVHPQPMGQLYVWIELDLLFRFVDFHPVQAAHEIEMPVGPAVFAVGRRTQSDFLLFGDGGGDAAVFDLAQGVKWQRAGLPGGAGGLQRLGTEQAADVIGAEGGIGAGHGGVSSGNFADVA